MMAKSLLDLATGKQPTRRGRSSYREFAEQCVFAQWCDLHIGMRNVLYSAMMDGINLPPHVAAQAKRKGVKKGKPDFFIFAGSRWTTGSYGTPYYCGLALEFKSPDGKGRASPEQERWAAGLRMQGWCVEFPTTAEEAQAIVRDYLGLKEAAGE